MNIGSKLILIFVSILCAVPFYAIAFFGKNSKDPIPFFSGDKTLKDKVKNVKRYNLEMFKLYSFYATVFMFAAISTIFYHPLGTFILIFNSTFGLIPLYIRYKLILKKCSI